MNYIFKSLVILMVVVNGAYAQDKSNYFEWVSHTTFDTVMNVGHKYLFYQYCAEDMDSLIANGTVAFSNTTIVNIPKCKYEMLIVDTIIEKVTITTDTRQNTAKLKLFAYQLCGELNHLYYKKKYHSYLSICLLNERYCALLYIEKKNSKKGKLIIMNSDL